MRRDSRRVLSSAGYNYQNETDFDVQLAYLEDELGIDTQGWMSRFWRAVDRLEPGFMPPYNWGWDLIIDLIAEGNRTPEEAAEDYINEFAAYSENDPEMQERVSMIEKVLRDVYGEDFPGKKLQSRARGWRSGRVSSGYRRRRNYRR